jgi:hypothetical protein
MANRAGGEWSYGPCCVAFRSSRGKASSARPAIAARQESLVVFEGVLRLGSLRSGQLSHPGACVVLTGVSSQTMS